MLVYRIAQQKYQEQTLSGLGADKVGGRWNEVGTRAVYCSEHISLALLEYYVHSNDRSSLPKDIVIAKIAIPDHFITEEINPLPLGWNQYPYGAETAKIFSNKAKNRDFFGIKVPSSIVALEFNVVLNPLYKEFGQLEVVEFIPLTIDARLRE